MADGKRKVHMFLNRITGEVIYANCRLIAYDYFKADGKQFGYKCSLKDIYKMR